jgi:hypothetical protein
LIAHSEAAERRFAAQWTGHTLSVLWENISGATGQGFINTGYTDHYVRVKAVHPRVLTNLITPARLDRLDANQISASPILDEVERHGETTWMT